MLVIGFEKCFTIIRFLQVKAALEYELTVILWIFMILNKLEDNCMPEDLTKFNIFQILSLFFFKFIIYGNTICYIVLFFIMVIGYIMNMFFSNDYSASFLIS